MNQTLHIFKKDTRRQWLEILASLVALALFAKLTPNQWNFSRAASHWQTLMQLSILLVPATWCVLIVRLVQDEGLVGDRQFWLTRPYEWKRLLFAKALFVVAWIYVPLLLAQAAILREAGFSALTGLAGWHLNLMMLSAYVLLPLAAVATITENFARMSLTLLGAIGVGIAAGYLANQPRGGYESNGPYSSQPWIIAVLVAGVVLGVVLQYAWRRVWLTRTVMIATLLLAVGVQTVFMWTADGAISRAYSDNGAAPMQVVTGVPPLYNQFVRLSPSERPGMVYVAVPVEVSGVADGAAVEVDDVKITVEDTAGSWTAPWWSSQTMRFLPGTHYTEVQTMLPRDQFKRLVLGNATMRVSLAVTKLAAGDASAATLPYSDDFAVRDFGNCSTRYLYRFSSQLLCRSALGQPPLTRVSATWYPKTCSDERMPNDPLTAAGWSGSVLRHVNGNPLFAVGPVIINLNPDWHDQHEMYATRGYALCPGTVVHFQPYGVAGQTQVSFDVPNSYFKIPGYRMDRDEDGSR